MATAHPCELEPTLSGNALKRRLLFGTTFPAVPEENTAVQLEDESPPPPCLQYTPNPTELILWTLLSVDSLVTNKAQEMCFPILGELSFSLCHQTYIKGGKIALITLDKNK